MIMKPLYSNNFPKKDQGLIVSYLFNHGQGELIHNYALDNELNATMTSTTKPLWVSNGLDFRSTLSYVEAARNVKMEPTKFTLVFRFLLRTIGVSKVFFVKSASNWNGGFSCYTQASNSIRFNLKGIVIDIPFTDTSEYHTCICKWDGSYISIQIDKSTVTPVYTGAQSLTSTGAFTLGGDKIFLSNYSMDGFVEYFRFYNYVLSEDAVNTLIESPYEEFKSISLLSSLLGSYVEPFTMAKRIKYFGANALPLGIGL